jgi:hypothetical protein
MEEAAAVAVEVEAIPTESFLRRILAAMHMRVGVPRLAARGWFHGRTWKCGHSYLF